MKTINILLSVFAAFFGPECVHNRGVTLAEVDSVVAQMSTLISAMESVESNGRDDATGDGGASIGRLQIQRAYWEDALAHCPEIGGTYRDVRDAAYARRVVAAYWLRYCPSAVEDHKLEVLARVHNGGPRGARVRATAAYWRRVEARL
jgi:hypothetical protein